MHAHQLHFIFFLFFFFFFKEKENISARFSVIYWSIDYIFQGFVLCKTTRLSFHRKIRWPDLSAKFLLENKKSFNGKLKRSMETQ